MSHHFLASPGGCGTHALNAFLRSQGLTKVPGWNTHCPWHAKLPVNDPKRLVYLYANPYDTIISFERREFMRNDKHLSNMSGNQEMLRVAPGGIWTLATFLKNGVDYFKLEKHFDTWFNSDDRYSVMFVKYEELPTYLPEMMKRWGANPKHAERFEFVPRKSNWYEQSDEIKQGLERMYGKFYERLEAMEGCFVR